MPAQLKITLVVTPKRCAKCLQCEGLVARLQEQFGARIEFVELLTTDAATQEFGVVLPPMLLVGDFLAAAGKVPLYDALARLVSTKLDKLTAGPTQSATEDN